MPLNTEFIDSSDGSELSIDLAALAAVLGGSASTVSVPFSTAIPFSSSMTVMEPVFIAGPVALTVDLTKSVEGAETFVTVIADGVNIPTLTGFTAATSTSGYDNRLGIRNVMQFKRLFGVYWYSIYQAVNAQPESNTGPIVLTARVTASSASNVVLTFNSTLDAASVPSTMAFTVTGRTVNSVAVSGVNVTLNTSVAFVDGDVTTVSYVSPLTNKLRSAAGVNVSTLSGQSIQVFSTSSNATLTARSAGVTQTGTNFRGNTTANSWDKNAVDALSINVNGAFEVGTSGGIMVGFTATSAVASGLFYSSCTVFVFSSTVGTLYNTGFSGGNITATSTTVQTGDRIRLRRTSTNTIVEVKRTGTSVYLLVATLPGQIGVQYPGVSWTDSAVIASNPTILEVF